MVEQNCGKHFKKMKKMGFCRNQKIPSGNVIARCVVLDKKMIINSIVMGTLYLKKSKKNYFAVGLGSWFFFHSLLTSWNQKIKLGTWECKHSYKVWRLYQKSYIFLVNKPPDYVTGFLFRFALDLLHASMTHIFFFNQEDYYRRNKLRKIKA